MKKEMKKAFKFLFGIVIAITIIVTVLRINSSLNPTVEIIEVTEVDTTQLPRDPLDDTPLYPDGMTEEEYIQELMKGANGDYTQEQVDSMQRSWAEQGLYTGD